MLLTDFASPHWPRQWDKFLPHHLRVDDQNILTLITGSAEHTGLTNMVVDWIKLYFVAISTPQVDQK